MRHSISHVLRRRGVSLMVPLAAALAAARAAPPDASGKAPGAMFTHDELRRQFKYSVVAAVGPDSPRNGDAVVTYAVWSPPFNRKDPRRADQCAIAIPRAFWDRLR